MLVPGRKGAFGGPTELSQGGVRVPDADPRGPVGVSCPDGDVGADAELGEGLAQVLRGFGGPVALREAPVFVLPGLLEGLPGGVQAKPEHAGGAPVDEGGLGEGRELVSACVSGGEEKARPGQRVHARRGDVEASAFDLEVVCQASKGPGGGRGGLVGELGGDLLLGDEKGQRDACRDERDGGCVLAQQEEHGAACEEGSGSDPRSESGVHEAAKAGQGLKLTLSRGHGRPCPFAFYPWGVLGGAVSNPNEPASRPCVEGQVGDGASSTGALAWRRRGGALLVLLGAVLMVAGGATATGHGDQGPYAGAQEDPDAAASSLQVVLDAYPELVRVSTAEADRDASPREGARLAEQMREHASAFEEEIEWANRASSAPLSEEAIGLTVDVAELAVSLPPDVATVARVTASCQAWQANATQQDRAQWASTAWPSFNRLGVAAQTLTEASEQAPEGLSGEPLGVAAERLESWRVERLEPSAECLPPPEFFFLEVNPSTAWPGARVLLQAGLSEADPDTVVHLSSPSLGLDRQVRIGDREGFVEPLRIPAQAALGEHAVTASLEDGREANASLHLEPIPTRLRLEHPSRVSVGEAGSFSARVTSPVPDAVDESALEVRVTGDVAGQLDGRAGQGAAVVPLDEARDGLTFTAPGAPGLLSGTVAFEGTERLAPASSSYAISVEAEDAVGVAERGWNPVVVGGGDGLWAFLVGWVEDAPWWAWALLGVAGLVVASAWLVRRQGKPVRGEPDPQPGPRHASGSALQRLGPGGAGLVVLFAAAVTWLREHGVVPASWTPRRVGDHLEDEWGIPSAPVVEAFERRRYDPAAPKDDEDGNALWAFWDRFVGAFR